jgi:hypothetical protein
VTDFDIFLSYNSVDKALVESVAQRLQSKGLNPWLDKWCLVPGLPWQLQLATMLRSFPAFGVFVGQSGLGDWAREELLVAQDRAAKERSFRIIPILLPGVPDPFGSIFVPVSSFARSADPWLASATGMAGRGSGGATPPPPNHRSCSGMGALQSRFRPALWRCETGSGARLARAQ